MTVHGDYRQLGETHPLLATMLGNYAGFLHGRGQLQRAISLVEEELAIREAIDVVVRIAARGLSR